MPPFVRSAYNYDMDEVSKDTGFHPFGEEVTIQSMKEECDINVIVERFGITHQLPTTLRAPISGDFTNIGDFQQAMNQIKAANDVFMAMPSKFRAELGNDPARFITWCEDPSNKDRMRELGLLRPGEIPKVPPVPAPPAS